MDAINVDSYSLQANPKLYVINPCRVSVFPPCGWFFEVRVDYREGFSAGRMKDVCQHTAYHIGEESL